MSLGLAILLVVLFGYTSNWLNGRYLNYKITHVLYFVGAFVHETSHALLCLLTGAKIYEFKVFSAQPSVTHGPSKIPFIGAVLISSAPIAGGLLFLYLINHYVLSNHFTIDQNLLQLLSQIRIFEWQSWVMIALFLNIGAMIGPSPKDIKNIWPAVVLLFFVREPFLISLCLTAIVLIIVNIAIQIVLVTILSSLKFVRAG